jgi:hypothetical protein
MYITDLFTLKCAMWYGASCRWESLLKKSCVGVYSHIDTLNVQIFPACESTKHNQLHSY